MRALLDTGVKAVIILATALLPAVGSLGLADDVPEPAGLWTGAMYGRTPSTLSGAAVVDLPAVEALLAVQPLLLDVGPLRQKPEGFPANRPWLPVHRSIPGAVWMPGAGLAPLDAEREQLFQRRIAELTGGDRKRPIVVFCRPDCWGSWNAGKRLVMQGYVRVSWFPAGLDSWQEWHETAEVRPDTAWNVGSKAVAQ
jgi:PQQ-dependent catabolism-associated CXXCW motif protein